MHVITAFRALSGIACVVCFVAKLAATCLPYANATVYSCSVPQDTAARTGVGSPDYAQTNITGVQSSFSATFASFSVFG